MRPVLAYLLAVVMTAATVGAAPAGNIPLKNSSAAPKSKLNSKTELQKVQANTLKTQQLRKTCTNLKQLQEKQKRTLQDKKCKREPSHQGCKYYLVIS